MRNKSPTRQRRAPRLLVLATDWELDPFLEDWLRLTPWQRLERSWALRRRIRNLAAVHDAKLFPQP